MIDAPGTLITLLIAVGVLGAVLSPLLLSRANADRQIPRGENRWIAGFWVCYGLSVAVALMGALLASISPLWLSPLSPPFILVVHRHNARTS